MTAQQVKEVWNCWTVYGGGTQPIAEIGRPQDWGHPRWVLHQYTFIWETAPDGVRYVNHCFCWADTQLEPGEYAEVFARLIVSILMPGWQKELCGRDYLQEDDFWERAWGPQPPFWDEQTPEDVL